MLVTMDALLAEPLVLLLTLAVGAAIGIGVERLVEGQRRAERRAYYAGRNARKSAKVVPIRAKKSHDPKTDLAADQLKIVMRAQFKARGLLNKPEARLFRELDRLTIERNPAWQVMVQVSLGEFLASEDSEAFRCINSKRVDLLLMDEHCHARHVIEYQGDGHYQGSAAARDAVKKEAIRKAGIGYHEIVAGHMTAPELRQLIARLVPGGKPAPAEAVEEGRDTRARPSPQLHSINGSRARP
jgi:hypothetical protein